MFEDDGARRSSGNAYQSHGLAIFIKSPYGVPRPTLTILWLMSAKAFFGRFRGLSEMTSGPNRCQRLLDFGFEVSYYLNPDRDLCRGHRAR